MCTHSQATPRSELAAHLKHRALPGDFPAILPRRTVNFHHHVPARSVHRIEKVRIIIRVPSWLAKKKSQNGWMKVFPASRIRAGPHRARRRSCRRSVRRAPTSLTDPRGRVRRARCFKYTSKKNIQKEKTTKQR